MRSEREPLRIFIGFDRREAIAYHVLAHSILSRATLPIAIVPLVKPSIRTYTRPRAANESTDFSLTRFMVPWLSNYEGWSVFMDCDMLARVDVSELLLEIMANRDKAVLACQHDYTPASTTKFLGHAQATYPRKNWTSFMAFNNERCKALTPDYVNGATGLELQRLAWLHDDAIGALPLEWNWLVGVYGKSDDAKMAHFTDGGPWFEEYSDCDYADEWRAEFEHMTGDVAMLRPVAGWR